MNKYTVCVKETTYRVKTVEAESEDDAIEIVESMDDWSSFRLSHVEDCSIDSIEEYAE